MPRACGRSRGCRRSFAETLSGIDQRALERVLLAIR